MACQANIPVLGRTPSVTYWTDYPVLSAELQRTEREITLRLERQSAKIRNGLSDFVGHGGKRLRPALVLVGAHLAQPDNETSLPDSAFRLAAGIELLHAATLIHDDILDGAATRRGMPSVHSRFGVHDAVLMGDFLFSQTFELFADHAGPENARSLAGAISRMCDSELHNAETPAVSEREYLRRILGKTALLFSLSLALGAGEHGATPELGSRLRRIGYCIGMAFQIQDDVLDLTGDPAKTGKPIGNDLREGTVTLPLIHAATSRSELLVWHKSVSGQSRRRASGAMKRIVDLVESRGGIHYACSVADRYHTRAVRELSCLPASEWRELLLDLVGRLTNRRG